MDPWGGSGVDGATQNAISDHRWGVAWHALLGVVLMPVLYYCRYIIETYPYIHMHIRIGSTPKSCYVCTLVPGTIMYYVVREPIYWFLAWLYGNPFGPQVCIVFLYGPLANAVYCTLKPGSGFKVATIL